MRFNSAKQLFEEGEKLRRAGNLQGALDTFRNSLKVNPNVAASWVGITDEIEEVEIGFDVERGFGGDLALKLIGLYRSEDFRETGSLVRIGEPGGDVTEAETVFESLDTEAIARIEV